MALEHKWTQSWDGSSGVALGPVELAFGCLESVAYVSASTIASTLSFAFQTAISSGGPWVTENSTSVSATASATGLDRIRVTGPMEWMRVYSQTKSTGTHTVRFMAVS